MNKERIVLVSHWIICIVGAALIGAAFIKVILPLIFPFVIAWGVAFAVRPIADRLHKMIKLPVRVIRPILGVLIILSVLSLLAFLLFRVAVEAWQLISGVGENENLVSFLTSLFNPFDSGEGNGLPKALAQKLAAALDGALSGLLGKIGSFITGIASAIPSVFIFIVVMTVSSAYFAYDLEKINAFIKRILPKKAGDFLIRFKQSSLDVAIKYLRSYSLIMLLTFSVMLLGFVILGVRYSLLIAVTVAFLDVLPVLGVGTVLVPWSVWSFITGEVRLGVGLVILFVVNEIIRQFAEPKII
jgi:sporulation integral membrane protein YtvI